MRSLIRAKEIVLSIVALGLPLVFFGRHEDEPFNVTKLSLLLGGVAVAAGIHLIQVGSGRESRAARALLIPAAALIVPLTLSWTFSSYREWALFGQYSRFTGLIPYVALALLGALLADAFWERRHVLAWGLGITGAVVGLYAFIQALGLDPLWQPGTDAGSPFPPATVGHYNFAGGFLAICLPAALYIWTLPRQAAWGMSLTIAIVAGLLMTNSQGGWLAAVAGAAIFTGRSLRGRWRIGPSFGLAIAASLTLLVIGGVFLSARADDPPLGGTAKSRWLLWNSAVSMAESSPLVGRGPSTYAVEGVRYRPLDYILLEADTTADDPHSVPLSFLANAGAMGLVGFLVLGGWILRRGFRLEGNDKLGSAFYAGAIAYLAQSVVSIDVLSLRAGLWVALAGLAASTNQTRESSEGRIHGSRSAGRILIPIGAAVGVIGLIYASGLMRAHSDYNQGKGLFADRRVAAAQTHFDRATGFRFEPHYLSAYARELGRAGLSSPDERQTLFARLTEVNIYLDEFPNAAAFVETARTYLYLGHYDPAAYDMATETLRHAAALDPQNPEIDIRRAEVLLAQGSASAALDLLETWEPRLVGHSPGFWGALASARAAGGDTAGGRRALEHALMLDANDCRVLVARGLFERIDEGMISYPIEAGLTINCGRGDSLYLQDVTRTYGL